MGRLRSSQIAASDSSDSDDDLELTEHGYISAHIAAALQRAEDYSAATEELTQLLQDGIHRASKTAQAAIMNDISLAITSCSGRAPDRRALAALISAVERQLPQAKRNVLLREYKKGSVALRRKHKKGSTNISMMYYSDSDTEPTTFNQLPAEVVSSVFTYLDPVALSCASCVCAEWRTLASEGRLWKLLLECTFSAAQRTQLMQRAQRGQSSRTGSGAATGDAAAPGSSGSQPGGGATPALGEAHTMGSRSKGASGPQLLPGWQQQGGSGGEGTVHKLAFMLGAQRHPQAVLMWRTNRILRNGQLSWLTLAERQTMLRTLLAGGGAGCASGESSGASRPPQLPVGAQSLVARAPALGEPASVVTSDSNAPQRSAAGLAGARRYRFLSAQDAVEYMRRGARLPASSSSGSESEGELDRLGARLKFWRVE